MREYETVFILHPKVDDAGIEREIAAVKEIISTGQGELIGVHKWGRRRLAYPIRKAQDGYYVLFRYHAGPEVLREMDRRFKLNESVLRNLTVLAVGEPFPPDLRGGRERRGGRGEGPAGRMRRRGGRGRGEDEDHEGSGAQPASAEASPPSEERPPRGSAEASPPESGEQEAPAES